MADTKKNTETKSAAKPKSTTKSKTSTKEKAKTKPKARTKTETTAKARTKTETTAKAETKNKANTADNAPYIKKDSKTESSHAESPKQKSSTAWIVLLVSAVLILTTIYKYNDERSNLPAQADPQENTADAETASATMMQENPANNNADTQSVHTPDQDTPLAHEKTRDQAFVEAQEWAAKNREMMQQRRQAFEKEMQSKQQQYQATIEANQQERAKIAEAQRNEFQRIRQNHIETRKKVQELQKQIFYLHEKIHKLIHESHTQPKPYQ